MKRILIALAGIIVVAGAIILINQNVHQKNGPTRAGISVGVIIPLSGDVAELGENLKRGIDMAIEGTDEKNIKFIYEDGGIEPRKALTAYQKLVSLDDTHIFIGPFGPDQLLSIAPILKSQEIMLGVTLCDERFKPYAGVFCTYPSIPDQTMSGIEAIKSSGVKKLGFITQTGELGDIVESELKKHQTEGNYSLVISERMKQGDRDFRTIITKVKAAGVDGIYTASLPDEGYILLRQLRELGYKGQIFSVFDAVEDKLAALGQVAEGVYLPGHISPVFKSEFTSKFKEKYGKEPDMYAALGHSIAINLINGLHSNSYKQERLKEKLIGTKTDTAIVGFEYKNDQTVSIPVESLIFKDGKIRELR